MGKRSDFAHADIDAVLERLSADEAISLIAGVGFWRTHAVPHLGIPSIKVSDGPNGIRGNHFFMGTPAKALPCATALGATWDMDLVEKAASKLLAEEAKLRGASVILAPTVNTQRSPLGGRSFESFAEDPHLSGWIATAYVSGVQKNGIGTCIKHFVGNDMENDRFAYDSIIGPRALREIYLMPFMIAEKYARPWAFMTAYNRVNGTHLSENPLFIKSILRGEWRSNAMVMSDWFGTYSVSQSINAGLDLEMPGEQKWRQHHLVNRALFSKKITVRTVKERARKVLELVKRCCEGAPEVIDGDDDAERTLDSEEDKQIMRSLAAASIVLLKNDDKLLPLSNDKLKKIAVIGPNAKAKIVSGGGSASLKASYFISPYDGIVRALEGSNVEIAYHQGVQAWLTLPTIEDLVLTEDGKAGFTGTWHSHSDQNFTVIEEPVKTQYIDETNMFFSNSQPKELTERFTLRLRATIKPFERDTDFEFGLTVAGRAKLYVDGKLVVDNWTRQKRGDAFFGTGTVEERGVVKLVKGKKHELFIDFCSVRGPAGDDTDNTVTLGGSAVRIGGAEVLEEERAIKESVELARTADKVIVVVGLNGDWESEGYDRTTMKLPGRTDKLVERVAEAAKGKTVIVTQSGSAIEMPWVDSVSAILHTWYLGNATGDAIADVLFGKINPSGKMSMTFPKRLEDTPSFGHFSSENGKVRYAEDLYVGYKHYQNVNVKPLFPFGHGLSYTTFSYSDLKISAPSLCKDAEQFNAQVSFKITNTGTIKGSETAQLYISLPPTPWNHAHPSSQLKGFSKVKDLEPGETRRVQIGLDKYAVSYWEEGIQSWRAEMGAYGVLVGASVEDIRLNGSFELGNVFEWNGL